MDKMKIDKYVITQLIQATSKKGNEYNRICAFNLGDGSVIDIFVNADCAKYIRHNDLVCDFSDFDIDSCELVYGPKGLKTVVKG